MIYNETILRVADNSGCIFVQCLKIYKKKNKENITNTILISIQKSYNKNIKKGALLKALILYTKKEIKRKNGIYIAFDFNYSIILTSNLEPFFSRIKGFIPLEFKFKFFFKLISLGFGLI